MSITSKINGQIDKNYVQVEMSHAKSERKRYYKVPNNKVDEFITSYKKNEQKSSIITNTAFATSIIAGVLVTSLLTRTLGSKLLKWVLNTLGGVCAAGGAIAASSNYIDKSHNTLLQKYNVKEITNS